LRALRRKVDYFLLNFELLRNKMRLRFYRESIRLERRRIRRGFNKTYIT